MIISVPSYKAFDKIQHPFMIKSLNKQTIERIFLYEKKSTTNIILNNETLKAFPLRSGTGQGCSFLPFLLNIVLELLASVIRQEKEIKGNQIKKK